MAALMKKMNLDWENLILWLKGRGDERLDWKLVQNFYLKTK